MQPGAARHSQAQPGTARHSQAQPRTTNTADQASWATEAEIIEICRARFKAGWVKAGWVKAGWAKAGWAKAGWVQGQDMLSQA